MMSNETCMNTIGEAANTFASSLHFFMAAQCLVGTDWPPDAEIHDSEVFDFIIVGAGTAGSVLANRLSEIEEWSVLLLEAGPEPPIETEIPEMHESLLLSRVDWGYATVNNGITNQAYVGGQVRWPRGKTLGGSSAINSMAHVHGHPRDYQAWFDEGNTEWHPDVVMQYIKKPETLKEPCRLKVPEVYNNYGHNGPLSVNVFNGSDICVIDNLLSALDEIGIKNVVDLNTAKVGSARFTIPADNGKRVSSATAYLYPIARSRKNLKIVKNSHVNKIILDGRNAYGVEVDHNGARLTLKANHEVILSAGSINTPQLLMLSGIGPSEHLAAKNIRTVINSPMVGQNLQDHTYVPIFIFANEPEDLDSATKSFEALRYLYDRQGYLASAKYQAMSGFYTTDPYSSYPEYQAMISLSYKYDENIKNYASLYIKSVENSILKQSVNQSTFMFWQIVLHPHSRGNISLNSNDPYEYPLIFYNNYSDLRDLDSQVLGIKILAEIVNTTYFKSIGGKLGRMALPACDGYEFLSDHYWRCIAVNFAATVFHPISTARMGSDISNSVVDSRLKVHGASGLRVIDASVIPSTISGNINSPVMMVAERAADLIKQDYNKLSFLPNLEMYD